MLLQSVRVGDSPPEDGMESDRSYFPLPEKEIGNDLIYLISQQTQSESYHSYMFVGTKGFSFRVGSLPN